MIRNIIKDIPYIGQTRNFRLRYNDHMHRFRNNKHPNQYMQRSYNKYGEESFEFSIIEECEEHMLDERELYWINFYGGLESKDNYNLGGIRGGRHSEETRQKISKSHTGKKLSKEHKNKISKSGKGHAVSKETREKLKKANKGHVTTEEQKEKLRNARYPNQKRFIAFDKNGIATIHYNQSEFERENKVCSVSKCLSGKTKSSKGWTFKYYEEGDEEKYGFEYKDRK